MSRLDDDELSEYIELYNNIVEDTLLDYEDPNEMDDLWALAQTNYLSYTQDNVEISKLSEAAIYKDREYDIDWRECMKRINMVAFDDETIYDYLPLQYAGMAGDEIINHAVESDIKNKLKKK